MKTLMELVDNCSKVEFIDNSNEEELLEKAGELEKLGFSKVAEDLFKKVGVRHKLVKISELGYIKISEKQIGEYLDKKVKRYNEEHKKEGEEVDHSLRYLGTDLLRTYPGSFVADGMSFVAVDPAQPKRYKSTIEQNTCDYCSNDEETIGRFCWTETPVEAYEEIPPTNILKTLKTHKDKHIFDYFTIAKVNEVTDPLLLGRIDNNKDRYFICQWGNDIQLDDLL